MSRDQIYSEQQGLIENFRFDEEVVNVFQDMIQRSVPGYGMVVSLVGVLAGQYLQPGSRGYDLGASLGASTLAMSGVAGERGCRLAAIDNSEAMVERCRQNLERSGQLATVELRCEDVRKTTVRDASLVVMNYTLQFIPTQEREAVLSSIAAGMRPGGAFLLSEKISFEDEQQQRRMEQLHHAFKRANGYSELEISQKRAALEEVLLPETLQQHLARLREVGFSSAEVLFQALNFVSILAIR